MSNLAQNALLARFNADNPQLPVAATAANVTFGAPTALSGDASGRNTSVVVTGHGPYTNAKTIYYNRVDLTALLGAASNVMTWTTQTSSGDLLAAFNALTGANLAASDIVVEALPTKPGAGDTAYTLKANASSLAFQGSVALSLHVAAALQLSGTLAPNATVGTAYSSTLNAVGGTPPYTVALSGGDSYNALPSGMALAVSADNTHVTLTGTPTVSRYSNLIIQITDALGATALAPVQALMVNSGNWAKFGATAATYYQRVSDFTVKRLAGSFSDWEYHVVGMPRGKCYFEMHVDSAAANDVFSFGIDAHADGSHQPGFAANEVAMVYSGGLHYNTNQVSNYPVTYVAGDVAMLAVDATNVAAVKVWIGRNGSWLAGNPATGASPMATLNWSTGTWQFTPDLIVGNESGRVQQGVTVRTQPSAMSYTAPAGFSTGYINA